MGSAFTKDRIRTHNTKQKFVVLREIEGILSSPVSEKENNSNVKMTMHYLLKNRKKKIFYPLQKNGTYSKDVRPRWAFVVLKFQGLLQGDLYRGYYIPYSPRLLRFSWAVRGSAIYGWWGTPSDYS